MAATVSLTSGLENISRNLSNQLPRIDALLGANFDLICLEGLSAENHSNSTSGKIKHKSTISLLLKDQKSFQQFNVLIFML